MRITTFSNNRIFGQNRAQNKQSANNGGNIVADMAQTLRDNAQSGLQAAAQAQQAVSRQDKVELSVKEAVKGSAEYAAEVYQALTGTNNKQEMEKQMAAQAAKAMQESLEQQAESARDQAEAVKEAMDYMLKMLEIARRISGGGEVPGADEQKLLEYSQVLYTMAKTMAMQAKEHEKYDSLFEDEEAQSGGVSAVDGAAAAGGEVAAGEGGGEAASAPAPAAEVTVE